MSTKKIRTLLWVFSFASILLVYSQVKWVLTSYEIQKQKFEENIKQIMNQVVLEVEQKDFLKVILKDTFDMNFRVKKNANKIDSTFFHFHTSMDKRFDIRRDTFNIAFDSLKNNYWIRQVRTYLNDSKKNKSDSLIAETDIDLIVSSEEKFKLNRNLRPNKDKFSVHTIKKMKPFSRKTIELLDTLLLTNFKKLNLELSYHFAIMQGSDIVESNLRNYNKNINKKNALKVRLNSKDLLFQKEYLLLEIINSDEIAIYSIITPSFFTILIILIIIVTAYASISTNFKQKKTSEIKNDFINNMTHELKTPISTISLAAEALRKKTLKKDKITHYADIIYDENKRLADQVEQILQLARIEKGEIALKKEQKDLKVLMDQVLESFKLHFNNKVLKLEKSYTELETIVMIDQNHIFNCLYNIIDNSLKYSGVTLILDIRINQINEFISLSIIDNGIGMSKEVLNHVFEKFYRAPTGDLHDVKGYGIGLSYVYEIIKLHDAKIEIKSEENKGTEVILLFPKESNNENTIS